MDTLRMRPGDYPAVPLAWQLAAGPGDGRYGVQYDRYDYMNSQCRYCGGACPGGAAVGAHPRTACMACGTPQCDRGRTCLVCVAGWLRTTWNHSTTCGYKDCDGAAVADAPRVRQVCLGHLDRPTRRWRGQAVTLAEDIAARLARRDRRTGLERTAWFGPPKRYYVRHWKRDGELNGWTGPFDTAGQADREAEAWTDPRAGDDWHAERVEATAEVREQVRAWQAAADQRHGRTVRR
jgi:hypothetical protein